MGVSVMWRFWRAAFISAFSLLVAPSIACAEKRVALVIGNTAYRHTPRLDNPQNDATDFAAAITSHGFKVIKKLDLNKRSFERALQDFAAELEGATTGVFFYAGHGLQVDGVNYLVPVDAKLSTAVALEFEMIQLAVVQRLMERQTNTNLLMIDACRDNPLARNLARAMGTRSSAIGVGLAKVEGAAGTLISFSTQPGNVASDGTGRNSPYSRALVRQLQSGRDDLGSVLIEVRNDVIKDTQGKQVPWEHSALTKKFYFQPPIPATSLVPIPSAQHPFDGAWMAEFNSETCAAKSGRYSIIIRNSEVSGLGAVVSSNGEVTYATTGRANSTTIVYHRVKLIGNSGTGSYEVPGTVCIGTEVLKRMDRSQPAPKP